MYVLENKRVSRRREYVPDVRARSPVICLILNGRESTITRLAQENLEQEGFGVRKLSLVPEVLPKVEQFHPYLIIIETTQSRERAMHLCRRIRRLPSMAHTPVMLIAAEASEEERIHGLESGADDYVTASSGGREIVARVRAVIRRFARQEHQSSMPALPGFLHSWTETPGPSIRMGDIEIDPAAMRISVRGTEVLATNLEFRLLYYLVYNKERVFSRDQLLDAVWGAQYVEVRSVDACVRRLRRKIEPDPLRPTYLKTVRGAGYRLRGVWLRNSDEGNILNRQ